MKNRVLLISLAVVLAISLVVIGCPPDGNGNGNGDEIIVQWDPAVHGEVAFSQLSWMGSPEEALYPHSNVGTVQFFFAEGAGEWLLAEEGGAWLNVAIDTTAHGGSQQWAVQNLYLVYPDPDHLLGSEPSVQFSLGLDGETPLEMLDAAVFLSYGPLEEQPEAETLVDYLVDLKPYLVGGIADIGGGSEASDIPQTIGPWFGPFGQPAIPDRTVEISIPVKNLAQVDEGQGGCAPGAVARSIHYLGQHHGFATDAAQDIYDDLVESMDTVIGKPGGTTGDNMLSGKNAYCAAKNLTIDSDIVWTDQWNPPDPPPDRVGFGVAADQAMDALADGGDVEILIGWSKEGGHVGTVTSITKHADGSYTIRYVDDFQGTPSVPNTENVIHVKANGTFAKGAVVGFMIQSHIPPD